jgi:hypothetical protein
MKTRKTSPANPRARRKPTSGPVPESELPTGPTGRSLVVLNPNHPKTLLRALNSTAGIKVASSSDFEDSAVSEAESRTGDGLLLEHLNVAIVDADSNQLRSLEAAVMDSTSPILAIEPEEYVIPFNGEDDPPIAFLTDAGREYFRGYSEAIKALTDRLLGSGAGAAGSEAGVTTTFVDTAALTWGLQATRVGLSRCTGAGIRVAVLDTGFDFNHPDFVGRAIVSKSFVPGVLTAQDGHSHGTHCIGTSCGPKTPAGNVRRYGIAYQATILVGKVLSNAGSGQDGWILAGINWAIQNQATIISMSLGSQVAVGATFKQAYEQAAQAALNANCLIIAAAGNAFNTPVGSPANCPSIMAVAAVDNNLQRAAFSCQGINPNGGEVNIAGPGVNTYSSVPMPTRYGVKSGTSMATPHVAGIAALWAQNTGLRGMALWQKLVTTVLNINQPVLNVGKGLVQAPRCGLVVDPFPFPLPIPVPFPGPIPGPNPLVPGPLPGPDPGPIIHG